mgnify:CR=1 FL=1
MKENKKQSYKIVFSNRVAYELRKQGFPIVKVEPNKYKPQYDCYFFEETEEFKTAFDAFLSKWLIKYAKNKEET